MITGGLDLLAAHDLFCLYPTPRGHVAALRGLTLDLAAGERVVVHGPNGSGKTTLLRVLIGERAPSAGTVVVCGVDLTGADERDRVGLRRRRLGLVDQQHGRGLRAELSVLDNVALQSRLGGMGAAAARDRARAVLDDLGLGGLADRRPATLSGGEAQRVAVCAAVAHGPALVLADEPTAELDRDSADQVYDLLAAAAAQAGAGLVIVSHDARAGRIADRIVRIRDGRLSEEWSPARAGSLVVDESLVAAESLVVDDRGWVRLPEPLRRHTGVLTRARASRSGESIVLTAPPGGRAEPPDAGPDRPVAAAPAAMSSVDAAAPPLVRLRGVGVDRDRRRVLDGQDLELRAGTLTVVAGRSGSGKTTLLRVVCGLERPDAGTAEAFGRDLARLDRAGLAALRRGHIAVCGQSVVLLDAFDVTENLRLSRLARGRGAAVPEELIASLGLTPLRDRPVHLLSGGERQRVAVAGVLAAQTDLAVLDEPTAHQDEAHAEKLAGAFVQAARTGAAVLVATHDPVLLAAADTVIDLGRG
ncbi:MAG: ATP-binding cassette domain-containing protein [Micromonosporaceae bacterium]